MTSIVSL